MRIAIDVSPLESGHKVRGVGFYLKHLRHALEEYFPDNEYTFFTRKEEISQHIDVIHYPYFDPFFLTLPANHSTKTVVTVHDLTPIVFPKAFPSGMKGKIRWFLQKRSLKRVHAIITDSEASKKDIHQYAGIPLEKIHVVYLAAGEAFKPVATKQMDAIRKKYALPEKFLLYVGDVTWNKNLPRLLRAVAKTDIPLVMVGKAMSEDNFDRNNPWNADRLKVKELADANPKVFRLGFIPDDDLVTLYNAATVLIVPSLYEGFGLPLLEAMSCGTPIITSDRGSIPEVAGKAAYVIDADDTNCIKDGIEKVFGDKKLQEELREEGLKQSTLFSWKETAAKTLAVYTSVV